MYIPPHFQIADATTCYDIIKEHSFATLFSQHHGMPFATHLPLLLDQEHKTLHGHLARSNPQWTDMEHQPVLAVFHGPHCYISPSWYETKTAVPTWNYVTVHVYGEVELIEDEQPLMKSLREMVRKYERAESPYSLREVEADFLAGLRKAIQGFKLHISKIEGKAKLSQNHSADRQKLVIDQLEQIAHADEQMIASLMKAQLNKRRS